MSLKIEPKSGDLVSFKESGEHVVFEAIKTVEITQVKCILHICFRNDTAFE